MPGPSGNVPFVGRQRELSDLLQHVEAARRGEGGVVLIAGEPGIGKTRLVRELVQRVSGRNGRALFGRAYESAGLPPYVPFIEALRDYVRNCPLEQLKAQLGAGAPEVALLVRELRARVPDLPPRPPLSAEEERYRLFESVSDFLRAIASASPQGLLLCLDDLQWADRPSLLLLCQLAGQLADAPLLLVGTYRTVDLDRAHPLADVLAELSREHLSHRLVLAPLSVTEAGTLIDELTGTAAATAVVTAIYRATEGNPFFVEEVVRHLLAEGRELANPGAVGGDWGIPERQVLGKRLSRLSPDANRLLQAGAVLGEGFTFEVLRAVCGLDAPVAADGTALLDALDEALGAGLLREEAQGYHFTHALVRQTLAAELSLPRQRQLHRHAAETIARIHARNLEPYVAQLAYHCFQAAPAGLADQAVDYARRAGERAQAVFAYEEATRFYELALQALDLQAAPDPAQRCDLLLALGGAQMPLGVPRRVVETIGPGAFALAEQLADGPRATRACLMVLEALHRDTPQNSESPAWRDWAQRADRYAAPGTAERPYADVALARAAIAAHNTARGIELLERALGLARDLDDPELLFTCAWQAMRHEFTPRHWRRAVALAQEFIDQPRDRVRSRTLGQVLEFCGAMRLADGDRAAAELAWAELSQLAGCARDAFVELNAMSFKGLLATLDGRLEEAAAIARQMLARGEQLGTARTGAYLAAVRCGSALLHLGRADEVQALARTGGITYAAWEARALALAGQREESQRIMRAYVAENLGGGERTPVEFIDFLVFVLEAAVIVEDRDIAALLAPSLADVSAAGGSGNPSSIPSRHLGDARVLLGDRAQARASYQQALEQASKIHNRPEIALIRLPLAELLLEHYPRERVEAVEHLNSAIAEFQVMNMRPALARACGLRDHRHLVPQPSRPRDPDRLTQREVEVLGLLAEGKSNHEIAELLIISRYTVMRHVSSILGKTGCVNRTEAATYGYRQGLLQGPSLSR